MRRSFVPNRLLISPFVHQTSLVCISSYYKNTLFLPSNHPSRFTWAKWLANNTQLAILTDLLALESYNIRYFLWPLVKRNISQKAQVTTK